MTTLVERIKGEKKPIPEISGIFFGLRQKTENNPGGYEWEIVQIQIRNGQITETKTSPASVKEVTANRLATILQNGETVDSLL